MKSSEIIKLINSIEDLYPVDKWTIDDIHVWPIIRINLFHKLFLNNNFSIPKPRCYFIKIVFKEIISLIRHFLIFILDYKNNAKLNKKVDVVFLSQSATYVKIGKTWYDRICNPVIDCLEKINKSYFILQQGNDYIYPRSKKSALIRPVLIFIGMFFSRLYAYINRRKKTEINLNKYEDFLDYLNKKNILNYSLSLNEIKKQVIQIKLISKLFEFFLKRTQPRVAFQVSYYGDVGYAFNLACKNMNIESVDLQHGIQGEYHVSYARWNKVPLKGYELLPQKFFCWSDDDANIINNWCAKNNYIHSAVSFGNHFVNKCLDNKDNDIKFMHKIIKSKISIIQRKYSRNIIYTLNGYEDNKKIHSIMEMIKCTSEQNFWWLRCHPCRTNQKRTLIKQLNYNKIVNVNLELATEIPIYVLLKYMDLHITECSSVVIDASILSVPSIVTTDYGAELYETYINKKYVYFAQGQNDVFKSIESIGNAYNILNKNYILPKTDRALKIIKSLL